jgi:hypothetical protein
MCLGKMCWLLRPRAVSRRRGECKRASRSYNRAIVGVGEESSGPFPAMFRVVSVSVVILLAFVTFVKRCLCLVFIVLDRVQFSFLVSHFWNG